MTQPGRDSGFPTLFAHSTRTDWGLGILSGESDGKRRYLFENGEERTMAAGFHEHMRQVQQPDRDQQATYARLRARLSARQSSGQTTPRSSGAAFISQLEVLHQTFPAGLLDAKWTAEIRGERDSKVGKHRDATIARAQELLSSEALDTMLSGQRFGEVWAHVNALLSDSDLVPPVQFRHTASGEPQRALASAVRELLHGSGAYEPRFSRYLAAFMSAFGHPAHWEIATVLPALVHPKLHVCVDPAPFRKQLNAFSSGSIAIQPSAASYTRFTSVARLIANKLAEQGEVPRDLFDVREFVCFTLKPVAKARVSRAKPKATRARASDDDNETE